MANVIDKLISEVSQYSLQDIHIVAEQNRKKMEAAAASASLAAIIQGMLLNDQHVGNDRKHKVIYDSTLTMELPPADISKRFTIQGNSR